MLNLVTNLSQIHSRINASSTIVDNIGTQNCGFSSEKIKLNLSRHEFSELNFAVNKVALKMLIQWLTQKEVL